MRIGILPSFNEKILSLSVQYLRYAEKFGVPTIINLTEQVEDIDWLWISGGADVDPTLFGFDNISSSKVQRALDKFQLACVDAAIKRKIPIFGICRGFQLLAYKLYANDADAYMVQHVGGHNQMDLTLNRDDLFHSVYRPHTDDYIFVNSMHHQGLAIAKTAAKNYREFTHLCDFRKGEVLIEGFDMVRDGCRIQGVQYHPEELMEEFPFELPFR